MELKNKIDPGKSLDKDLYALSESEVKKIPTVCGSLREAMENLDKDRKFLTQGNVFTDDQIDATWLLSMKKFIILNTLHIQWSFKCTTVVKFNQL